MKIVTENRSASKPVRFFASVCLVPKIITELPKAGAEIVRVFADDVKEEMGERKAKAKAWDHRKS